MQVLNQLFARYHQFIPLPAQQSVWVQLKEVLTILTSVVKSTQAPMSNILPSQVLDLSVSDQYNHPWLSLAFAVEEEVS